MNFSDTDIRNAKNLLRAIKKATFNDMLGEEILAFHACLKWLAELIDVMENPPQKKEPKVLKERSSRSKKR